MSFTLKAVVSYLLPATYVAKRGNLIKLRAKSQDNECLQDGITNKLCFTDKDLA